MVVLNKADLLNKRDDIKSKTKNVFLVSALEGRGVNKIVEN